MSSLDRHTPALINGRCIAGSEWLKHGDILQFGSQTYKFIDPDASIRRRNRRLVQAAVAMLAIALVAAAHADERARGWFVAISRIARSYAAPQNPAPATTDIGSRSHPQLAGVAPTPTAAPHTLATTSSPQPTLKEAPLASDWLERINHFRALAGLPKIKESSALSVSVDAHAHYLMANFADKLRGEGSFGDAAYKEDSAHPGYSPEGAAAAANSQIAWGCGMEEDQAGQIDRWISGPFHRLEMLSPTLQKAGFGEIASDGCWVAALRLPPVPDIAGRYPIPVMFPPDGATVSLTYMGGEFPNPLAACSDYTLPTGLPITLQIGRVMDIDLGTHGLTEDGRPVAECAHSAKSYRNPDQGGQEYGRWELRSNSAVVMIPRAPLRPGAHYKVSIAANDRTYTWSFTIAE